MNRKIAFLHPDLGIGGAERAIVDAAIALKGLKFDITIFTNYHDINHCFDETKNGELKIKVIGSKIPRSFLGKFMALFAYLKFAFLALYIIIIDNEYDLLYVDQISAPIPLLKIFNFKVLFFAHFPDFLLTDRKTFLKRCYRFPIDKLEKVSMGYADMILFNSNFTKNVYDEHFDNLSQINKDILYPVPNFANAISYSSEDSLKDKIKPDDIIFLSINRYEEKKNIRLAIEAFAYLRQLFKDNNEFERVHLVHMGGYDESLMENQKTYAHLEYYITSYRLMDQVHMLKSCSNDEKVNYLKKSRALIYTPSNEHFGIVPIEAMYLGLPVIAVNSGGPRETVIDGQTGFLCDSKPEEFAAKMKKFLDDPSLKESMGKLGKERVMQHFSYNAFKEKLGSLISILLKDENKQ